MRGERGSLLIPLIVGMVIVGLLAYASESVVVLAWKDQQNLDFRASVVSLRNYITAAMDCDESLLARPAVCDPSGNGYLALKSLGPTEDLIAEPVVVGGITTYTKIGGFSLRVSCVACTTCSSDRKLLIEYAKLDNAGNPMPNSVTGRPMIWKDLLEGIPAACLVPP